MEKCNGTRLFVLFILIAPLISTFWQEQTAQASSFSLPTENQELCHFQKPTQQGKLSIDEASGLAISRQFNDRFYHNNDSGDGAFIYLTNQAGSSLKKISLKTSSPTDNEDLSLGPCPIAGLGLQQCLFLADIGDNGEKRSSIRVVAIKEEADFVGAQTPVAIFKLRYPDGPHNAESLAVHPNGNLYIVTKTDEDEQLFYLPAAELWNQPSSLKTLKLIPSFKIPGSPSQLATGMSISPDGKKFIVLTYKNAIEYNIDLGDVRKIDFRNLQAGRDYQVISLKVLPQQEAISYANTKKFYYTSEINQSNQAPIMQVSCP